MANKLTPFQKINSLFNKGVVKPITNTYTINDEEFLKFDNKEELDYEKLKRQQNLHLTNQWKRVEGVSIDKAFNVENTRMSSYTDFENMEFYPEIASALDTYMEECLHGSTIIPLLNGKELTIKEIYENNLKDFWVYSVDLNTNKITPSKVEKAILKGTQKVFKVTLDDDTEILCTDNHKWLRYDNTWIETKDLIYGESLKSMSKRLDYKGYEKVSLTNFNGDTKHTHTIVAENVLKNFKEQLNKNNPFNEKIVVHHKSFNKLNNDPNELEYMLWSAHQKLHTDLNKKRWENEEFSTKMRKIFSENAKKLMANIDKKELAKRLNDGLKNKLATLTLEEQKKLLNRGGKHNGMYGSERFGKLNPNYDHTKTDINDIDELEYIKFNMSISINRNKACAEKFNLNRSRVIKLNKKICEKYGVKCMYNLDYLFNEGFNINNIKNYFAKNINSILEDYANEYNIKPYKIYSFLRTKGYKNLSDLKATIGNHRVIKVEYHSETEVYDLVNSSVSQNFAVKCNNGYIISHNCTTVNEKGDIINIYSDSQRVKNILEDLFNNRLSLHTTLPMWTRNTGKYGDNFIYLNLDSDLGVKECKQLPNYEIERSEVGLLNQLRHGSADNDDLSFIWRDEGVVFKPWQVVHFRLLGDDRKLPYGVSLLEKSRRIWKMLMMAEDAMLVYRITRAPERRVYKVFVGNIDELDVPAYIQDIANKFKRDPVIDPKTGQVDLKYKVASVDQDFFIPVRNENAANPIDTLPGACLSLDTKIEVFKKGSLELSEIIERFDKGEELWAYSVDPISGKFMPGKITWAGVTRKNTDVVKITLDNDETIICTPDHKFPLKNGEKVQAKDLMVNDSLFSFNREYETINGYDNEFEKIYDHYENEFVMVNRIFYDNKKLINTNAGMNIKETLEAYRFSNRFKKDKDLLILLVDTLLENRKDPELVMKKINTKTHPLHIKFYEMANQSNDFVRRHNKKVLLEDSVNRFLRKFKIKNLTALSYKVKFFNHKVKSVEFLTDKIDTGTITIDGQEQLHDFHTFALTAGVYTYNSNLDAIADIEYLQNKLFTSLRVPKPFLSFDSSTGDGKNLALQDVRFSRTINRVQQSMLLGLNQIAILHLYLLGFDDEIDNFRLTLNNPSSQANMLRIEMLQTKLNAYKDAVSDAGNGFQPMSMSKAKKEILGMSDDEIRQDLLEQRLEKAAAAELDRTTDIIKRTKVFDKVDNIYGDPNAKYEYEVDPSTAPETGSESSGGGGGGFTTDSLGGGFEDMGGDEELGGDIDLGGDVDTSAAEDLGDIEVPEVELPDESTSNFKTLIFENYKKSKQDKVVPTKMIDRNFKINKSIMDILDKDNFNK